jgi:molybdenum cofactor sulfurtransferase
MKSSFPEKQKMADPMIKKRLAYNDRIDRLRKSEYLMLKGISNPSLTSQLLLTLTPPPDLTYLDHGGTTMTSVSLLKTFCDRMGSTLLANPHSDAANPSASSILLAETRLQVLEFASADPDYFDVVFTANTTAAVKLVMECFSGLSCGFDYAYHSSCHTSLIGVRELARNSHCFATDEQTERWLTAGRDVFEVEDAVRPILFAYPAQSNMNGQRLPLDWSSLLRQSGHYRNTYTLLDVAAFASTGPLDLSNPESAPDFTVLSFYKIFGFPDLGALIIRKASSSVLGHRRYFGGGTTEMVTCFGEKPWVARKETGLPSQLEDGTVAVRSVLALQCAFRNHQLLFGSMRDISQHVTWLGERLYERLEALKHPNGVPVCHFYKAATSTYGNSNTQGATIALNIRKDDESWMSPYAVGALLRNHKIHVRVGSLCNPAGMASALDLKSDDMKAAFEEGFRCNRHDDVRAGGKPFGMIRVTLGAMSTLEDILRFTGVVEKELVDRKCKAEMTLASGKASLMRYKKEQKSSLHEKGQVLPEADRWEFPSKAWRTVRTHLPHLLKRLA